MSLVPAKGDPWKRESVRVRVPTNPVDGHPQPIDVRIPRTEGGADGDGGDGTRVDVERQRELR